MTALGPSGLYVKFVEVTVYAHNYYIHSCRDVKLQNQNIQLQHQSYNIVHTYAYCINADKQRYTYYITIMKFNITVAWYVNTLHLCSTHLDDIQNRGNVYLCFKV